MEAKFKGRAKKKVSDLAYADDIVILSSSYNEMQGLLEARSQNLSLRVTVGSIGPPQGRDETR